MNQNKIIVGLTIAIVILSISTIVLSNNAYEKGVRYGSLKATYTEGAKISLDLISYIDFLKGQNENEDKIINSITEELGISFSVYLKSIDNERNRFHYEERYNKILKNSNLPLLRALVPRTGE